MSPGGSTLLCPVLHRWPLLWAIFLSASWRLREQSLQLNDRGDFIRVIEFNYPFLELIGGCKANSPTLARSARGCLLWRAVCLVCSEPGFHVPSANTQRYSSSPHCQAHFKPCWVVSLNPRQWIPAIRSHKSALFWSDFHSSCFCHLHLYSLSHRWPGHHIAIFNNLALFLFELFFFKVGFASFGRKIESFQFCPYLNLTLCLRASHWKQGDAQLMTFWMTLYRWRAALGGTMVVSPLQDFE